MQAQQNKSELQAKPAAVGRDKFVDALRGLFLVIMTIDHFPNFLRNITKEFFGFVTAAEGFVFLSGYVAGKVYGRYVGCMDTGFLWSKALHRAKLIYLAHITLFLCVWLAGIGKLPLHYLDSSSLVYTNPLEALCLGLFLLYQPPFLDILPMYCVFILMVPLLVQQINRGRVAFVLIASGLVWLAAQVGIREMFVKNFPAVQLGSFDIFAWQFLFVIGVIAGAKKREEKRLPSRSFPIGIVLAGVMVLILFLVRHGGILSDRLIYRIAGLAGVHSLEPVRLINFLLLSLLVARIPRHWINEKAVGHLSFLGRHSLPVFTFHIACIYALMHLFTATNEFIGIITLAGCLAGLWGVAWISERIDLRRKESRNPENVIVSLERQAERAK